AGRGGLAGALGGGGRKGGKQQGQTVYVLAETADKKTELRQVRLRTGITDGHYTQVVSVVSGTLNPGDLVVTGLATIKVETSAGPPGGPLGGAAGGARGGPRGRF
ncbi:MAG: hypothetical protein WAM82_06220, partial [Thermoanaerobaculia bacterium]